MIFVSLFLRHLHFNIKFLCMKKLFGFLFVGAALVLSSCEDMLKSLDVTQDISMPFMDFCVNREQQKDGLGDILLDETLDLNLDSLMTEWGYSYADIDKCMKSMALKMINFRLKDTSYVHNFDFLDSARMTFATASVSEVTVAQLSPKSERQATSMMDLNIALEDITKFLRSKEQIRVRIYGKADFDAIPEELSYVEVVVGGMMRMELQPIK